MDNSDKKKLNEVLDTLVDVFVDGDLDDDEEKVIFRAIDMIKDIL